MVSEVSPTRKRIKLSVNFVRRERIKKLRAARTVTLAQGIRQLFRMGLQIRQQTVSVSTCKPHRKRMYLYTHYPRTKFAEGGGGGCGGGGKLWCCKTHVVLLLCFFLFFFVCFFFLFFFIRSRVFVIRMKNFASLPIQNSAVKILVLRQSLGLSESLFCAHA